MGKGPGSIMYPGHIGWGVYATWWLLKRVLQVLEGGVQQWEWGRLDDVGVEGWSGQMWVLRPFCLGQG